MIYKVIIIISGICIALFLIYLLVYFIVTKKLQKQTAVLKNSLYNIINDEKLASYDKLSKLKQVYIDNTLYGDTIFEKELSQIIIEFAQNNGFNYIDEIYMENIIRKRPS